MRKTAEGGYYYIARYIDDVMYFSKNLEKIIHYLEDLYTLKGVGYPQFYLGYVDADHARNNVTRRSVTGGYFE